MKSEGFLPTFGRSRLVLRPVGVLGYVAVQASGSQNDVERLLRREGRLYQSTSLPDWLMASQRRHVLEPAKRCQFKTRPSFPRYADLLEQVAHSASKSRTSDSTCPSLSCARSTEKHGMIKTYRNASQNETHLEPILLVAFYRPICACLPFDLGCFTIRECIGWSKILL